MRRPPPAQGRILLVGAGPGDPELLTLRAVRALVEADVVLVDDLVDRRVLEHARADARVIGVGKRGGCRATPQAWIERLMVREARAGRTVVRLKGGDPLVFGRGNEELAAARRAGIDCEVVSGVTSALAAAAAVPASLTQRTGAPGVILLTGHAAGDRDVDWPALVATGMTLVVYMGVARAGAIAASLAAARMPLHTPVAVVERASLPEQRTLASTLGTLTATLTRHRVQSPALLIVGDVAAAARQLDAVSATAGLAAHPRGSRLA